MLLLLWWCVFGVIFLFYSFVFCVVHDLFFVRDCCCFLVVVVVCVDCGLCVRYLGRMVDALAC